MAIDTNQAEVVTSKVDAKTADRTVRDYAGATIVDASKEAKKGAAMAKMSQSPKAAKANGAPVKRLPIGKGEEVQRGIEVLDDKHVKASFTFKINEKDEARYGATVLLDYTHCTLAEILVDATRSHVITLQRNLRGMGDGALDASVYQNVDVKRDLIETTRSTVDPETRDLHAFARAAKLSHDDARKFLAAIKAGTLKL